MKKIEKRNQFGRKLLSLLALLPILLAGCESTVNARWANQSDSPDVWQAAMADIPLNIHNAGIAAQGPKGYLATQHVAERLQDQTRLELYIGGNGLPSNQTYCTARPALQPVKSGHGDILMAGALCSGDRLVATEHIYVAMNDISTGKFAQTLEKFKKRLVAGLAEVPYCPNQIDYPSCR